MPTHSALTGDLQQWNRITLDFNGPAGSEDRATFYDTRMDVVFTHADTGRTMVVPGFFAADGDAAETGAETGTVWRVNFNPPLTGAWSYEVSFRKGNDIAAKAYQDAPNAGSAVAGIDGAAGGFTVGTSEKTGLDLRARGLLEYNGDNYLNFAGDGTVFLKSGVGSPENFLGYSGFDATPDNHDFTPHVSDWQTGDPTWKGGEGKGIIGAVNYLAEQGVNSAYMMLNNIGGDGRDVSPWADDDLYQIPKNPGNVIGNEDARIAGFDVSKLAQWDIVFSHMQSQGITAHVFFQETENDQMITGGDLGVARAVYMREMVARFGDHNGLIWNLGEENTNTLGQLRDHSEWLKKIDAYDHPVALHTYPGNSNYSTYYEGLAGEGVIDVLSIQTSNETQEFDFDRYLGAGRQAGREYVAFYDEPGNASNGLKAQGDSGWQSNHAALREVLWKGYHEGGSGAEWYFGYQTAGGQGGDLEMEDFALREEAYAWAAAARAYHEALPLEEMTDGDGLVSGVSGDEVLAKAGEVYSIYLPNGGSPALDLSGWQGTFAVTWYDVITGEYRKGSVETVSGGGTVSLGTAPQNTSGEWAVMVTAEGVPTPTPEPTPDPAPAGAFLEQDGIVVIEMESLDLPQGWETAATYDQSVSPNINNPDEATGAGFVVWQGKQDFSGGSAGDNGLVEIEIEIETPGLYRFDWRSQVGNGTDGTEHNDTWVKIDADAFYGIQGGGSSYVHPRGTADNDYPAGSTFPEGASGDGFFKVYSSGANNWKWSARTSDSDAHDIYARFDTPGTYTVTVAARSSSHAIDRMILVNEAVFGANGRNLSIPQSSRAGTAPDPNPEPDPAPNPDPTPDPDPVPQPGDATVSFMLVDADSDTEIGELENGETLPRDILAGAEFSIRAVPSVPAGSIVFTSSFGTQTENVAPYAIFGDQSGDYAGNALTLGTKTVTAKIYAGKNGSGALLGESTIVFDVVEEVADPDPEPQPNLAPSAAPDSANTDEDVPVRIDVLDNDEDPENGQLTIEIIEDPANGVASVVDGEIRYVPTANFNGTDSLRYRAVDPEGLASETVEVSLTVAPVNDAPVVSDLAVSVAQGAALFDLTVAAAGFGTDPDGDPLRLLDVTGADNGTVVILGGGTSLSYAPDPSFAGVEVLTLAFWDGLDDTVTAEAALTVTVVADPEPDPDPLPEPPAVRFFLVNADTNARVVEISEGDVIDPAILDGAPFSVEAVPADSAAESVRLTWSNGGSQLENLVPYSLFSDSSGNFDGEAPVAGAQSVTATVFSADNAQGTKLAEATLNFSMAASDTDPDPDPQPEPDPGAPPMVDPMGLAAQAEQIVFHFDGNNNDKDDIAAIPVAALLAKAAGLEDKTTFLYGNNLSEPNAGGTRATDIDASAEFARSLGIAAYDYQDDIPGTTQRLVDIIETGDKITLLEGGPIEAVYRAMEQANPVYIKNLTLVSHSSWNENRNTKTRDTDGVDDGVIQARTWADLKADFPDATYVDIRDQNDGSNNDRGFNNTGWTWMDDADEPVIQAARAAMEGADNKVNDPSDAGMLFYAITGSENATPDDARAFFEATGLIGGDDPEPEPQPAPGQGFALEYWARSGNLASVSEIDKTVEPDAVLEAAFLDHSGSSFWPGGPEDRFSVRATGLLEITEAGTYDFDLIADDGAMLFIDGALVIDNDGAHGARKRSGELSLAEGTHAIEVLYFENTGKQVLRLNWAGPATGGEMVPLGAPTVGNDGPLSIDDATDPYPTPAPLAFPDEAETSEGMAVLIDVLANDESTEGASISIVTAPAAGTAVPADGGILYTPDPGATGTDEFTYRLVGSEGVASAAAEVSVDIVEAADSPVDGPSLRINAGGPAFTDSVGTVWRSDVGLVQRGWTYETSDFGTTGPEAVYGTERWARSLDYEIPLPDGRYDVVLKFAEIYFTADGKRVFDGSVEGVEVFEDLDLFAAAGGADLSYDIAVTGVEVAGGVLELDFDASVNNPKLSAILIEVAGSDDALILIDEADEVVDWGAGAL
ncbi:MAG: Ig-like domain-containing protein [Pikeienuella sp.]